MYQKGLFTDSLDMDETIPNSVFIYFLDDTYLFSFEFDDHSNPLHLYSSISLLFK